MRFLFKNKAIGSFSLAGQNFERGADGAFDIPDALQSALVANYKGEFVPPPPPISNEDLKDGGNATGTLGLKRSALLNSTSVKG